MAQSAEALSVRWTLPDGGAAQLRIERDGALTLSYAGMSEQPLHSWGLSAGRGLEDVQILLAYPPSTPGQIASAGILFEQAFGERVREDAWTRPTWYFQLVVSVLVVAILYAVRGRLDTLEQDQIAEALTRRQQEIAELVAEGRSNAEIGRALSITESTVKYHLSRIFQLLQIDDRKSLADWQRQSAKNQD